MESLRSQVEWTPEQWTQVEEVVATAVQDALVAEQFLPRYAGPVPSNVRDFPAELLDLETGQIDDLARVKVVEAWTTFTLNKQQIQDQTLSNATVQFRRAAGLLARLEDAIIFNGQPGPNQAPPPFQGRPDIVVIGGEAHEGLLRLQFQGPVPITDLVSGTAVQVANLEAGGNSKPFELVLSTDLYEIAHHPSDSLVLPVDRIRPLLEGGAVLRSGVLPNGVGLLVSSAVSPIDVVVAIDATPEVRTVVSADKIEFGVYKSFALRPKIPDAFVTLKLQVPAVLAQSAVTPDDMYNMLQEYMSKVDQVLGRVEKLAETAPADARTREMETVASQEEKKKKRK